MSHRLRQPITAIRWSFELMLLHLDSGKEVRELVQTGIEQTDLLASLLGNYLRLLEGPSLSQSLEVFSLGELLAEQARNLRESGNGDGTGIDHRSAPHTEVKASKERLRQSIEEVLRNCLSRSRSGLKIDCSRQGGVVRVEIEDSGQADQHEIDELFDPFATPPPGTGFINITMAVLRRDLRELGGDARAQGTETGGRRIVVELPHFSGRG